MSHSLRILVVDDEASIRTLLAEALKPNLVVLADSGYAALDILRSDHRFDLILLDYLMIGLDGLETLKKLKDDPATRNIAVILTSGLSDSFETHEALAAGAAAFLSKPIELHELYFLITRLFPNS